MPAVRTRRRLVRPTRAPGLEQDERNDTRPAPDTRQPLPRAQRASAGLALEPLTMDELREFIRSHRWKFARTQPLNPHEYLLRERCRDQHEFERAIHTINVRGFKERYGGRDYPVIDVDMGGGLVWKIWHMDQLPIHETKLINRALRSYEVPPDILRMVDMQSRITASLQRVLAEPREDHPHPPDPDWESPDGVSYDA